MTVKQGVYPPNEHLSGFFNLRAAENTSLDQSDPHLAQRSVPTALALKATASLHTKEVICFVKAFMKRFSYLVVFVHI